MHDHNENEAFARLIAAIEPWLKDVVIIGGWADRLYRLHPHAQALDYAPLMTLDTDVAMPARLPVKDEDIRERLVANGFAEQRFGEDNPPATHYQLLGAKSGFFAEFLTPLTGSERGRRGNVKRRNGLLESFPSYCGMSKFCYMLHGRLMLTGQMVFLSCTDAVRVANPAGFLAHKVLVQQKRNIELPLFWRAWHG